jgi:hypothetical protein
LTLSESLNAATETVLLPFIERVQNNIFEAGKVDKIMYLLKRDILRCINSFSIDLGSFLQVMNLKVL